MSDNKFTNSNNKYKNCPALMSDGRNFTDYRPISHINNLLVANNNLENNYNYREFLIQNAELLMDNNRNIAIQNNICDQCPGIYEESCNASKETNPTCLNGTQKKEYHKL